MLIAPDIQDCILGFSNISDWTVSYWQNMLENTGLAGENYLYFVSVDKDFPVLDRIKQEKLVYDKFEPWLVPVMAGSVLALILALAGVVLMTIGAGRNNEDKKVHLNFFDRCYTEIVAVVVFMIWLMGTSVIVQAMDDEEMRMVWKAIGFGTLGLWFGIWFLAGWLSLVRRIKARSLWRDSLLRHILLLVRKCFSKCSDLLVFLGGNMISRVKIILLFGIFIFLQFMPFLSCVRYRFASRCSVRRSGLFCRESMLLPVQKSGRHPVRHRLLRSLVVRPCWRILL